MQSNLTSLPPSLLLPDIRWEPIICTCSSTMSFLPFYPFIPSTLPHFTCLSSLPLPSLSFFPPAARILCLAIIYTHPAALLHPSFLFHFPLHLYVSQPPLIESPISCIATSIHMHTLTLKPISPASTRDSYCPSARQRRGIKSRIIRA